MAKRKVFIKDYLEHALGLSDRQMYRLFGANYDPKLVGKYIRKRGYTLPPDGRTKAARTLKAGQSPVTVVAPPDEILS